MSSSRISSPPQYQMDSKILESHRSRELNMEGRKQIPNQQHQRTVVEPAEYLGFIAEKARQPQLPRITVMNANSDTSDKSTDF